MPEARAASSKGKRKAPPSEHDAESSPSDSKAEGSQPQTATERPSVSRKKSKTVSSTSIDTTKKGKSVEIAPPANGMPTNTKLPDKIEFARPAEGSFRIASWNVCGLAACQKKGFKSYVEAEDADILILNETKVNNTPVDPSLTQRYPYQFWSISDTKGYAGTAILSKISPISSTFLIPDHPNPADVKGRIVTLEYQSLYVVGTYVPNAGDKLKTMPRKQEWNIAFEAHVRALEVKKPVIWMGDLNVCRTALDLKNDKSNYNKSAGYTQIEIDGLNSIMTPSPTSHPNAEKLVDVWRDRHPIDEHYTYFSYRFNCRAKQLGWRLDYSIVSEGLLPRIQQCEIRNEIYGPSDHLPIILDISGDL